MKELIQLSQKIKKFELAGTKLLVSPTASLEIANNKSRLYEFLQWRGIVVPEFRLGAGVNLPVLAIKQELGLPISPDELMVKCGTKFSRYWKEVFT